MQAFIVAKNRFNASRSPRLMIWENYWRNLDAVSLLRGVNIQTDPWPDGKFWEYNYHNSFIHLHAQLGLFGLVVAGILVFFLISSLWEDRLVFTLLLALLFRASTDFVFFSAALITFPGCFFMALGRINWLNTLIDGPSKEKSRQRIANVENNRG